MYICLGSYKKVFDFFGFTTEFKMNGLDEEYLECKKKTDAKDITVLLFQTALIYIICNGDVQSFTTTSPQELMYKLISFI